VEQNYAPLEKQMFGCKQLHFAFSTLLWFAHSGLPALAAMISTWNGFYWRYAGMMDTLFTCPAARAGTCAHRFEAWATLIKWQAAPLPYQSPLSTPLTATP